MSSLTDEEINPVVLKISFTHIIRNLGHAFFCSNVYPVSMLKVKTWEQQQNEKNGKMGFTHWNPPKCVMGWEFVVEVANVNDLFKHK